MRQSGSSSGGTALIGTDGSKRKLGQATWGSSNASVASVDKDGLVTGAALIALFEELHAQGQTVLLVTHDAQIASHAERTIRMRDGRVVDE